ncbi:DUF1472 domain-containing protein [Rhizobium laguerreae]|uniref:DUF1472 domain-containing protein n=1 Tax=Rhizobium laguerreae TaxID=1076926 RepID=A0AB35FHX1_9HYPH|nr:DUF1472 domain-containing protein [Rhizobium laguerreae]MBY3069674.1 DUF1472 domain-containing protein [Rhizobium laguerreae]MBY3076531.1 DUF1472 domain-containing protein [Rhizobium laguerreae]MBY3087066.1 DUF1472 domain-containing protein [Rhizobium laguerreae]MBY3089907.1 DUF1472 domain-containing protein [Rhizobium laguerreae]
MSRRRSRGSVSPLCRLGNSRGSGQPDQSLFDRDRGVRPGSRLHPGRPGGQDRGRTAAAVARALLPRCRAG